MSNHKVVLYNLSKESERGAILHSILENLEIPAEEIKLEELNQKIGFLAGNSGYFKEVLMYTGEDPECEFMLMAGLPEELLDKFLDEMQAQKLRIDYKAVVTEHNRDYTCIQLIEDIAKEHEMVQSYIKVNKLIKEAEALDPFIYGSDKEWGNVQQGIKLSKAILTRDNLTKTQLENVYKSLNRAYTALLDDHKSPEK